MLSVDYLRKALGALPEFTDTAAQVHASDGYDGVISILANIRGTAFPCVVLEDRSSGELGCRPGGFDSYSLVLWVMDSKGREEHFPGMDIASIPYNRRQGGPGCCGYELVISFFDDIDLSYGQ